MKRSVLLILVLVPFFSFARDPFTIEPYTEFRMFGWKEFGDDGSELLKESGTLYSFGAVPRFYFDEKGRIFAQADAMVYFGTVDYNGFLQDNLGNRTPYNTKTAYFGFELATSAAYVLPLSPKFDLTPRAGFGFEYWNRDLDNGGASGYDEKYTVIYFEAAVGGDYKVNKSIQFFSSFGMKIPFSISESIDQASRGQGGPSNISLSPGISPRFRFSAGTMIHNATLEFSYETWTLVKSNQDQGFLQPESTRKIFGIRLGYVL